MFMYTEKERKSRREYFASLIKDVGLDSTIDNFQNVLDVIWSNVFSTPKFDSYIQPRIRTCPGIRLSIGTLNGIRGLCEFEDFSDVYLLIRKLRDNLFLDLFLFEAQKTFEKAQNNSSTSINIDDTDEIMKELKNIFLSCAHLETTNAELKAINKWKSDKLLMSNDKTKKEYFEFEKYLRYLKNNNEDFKECYDLFLKNRFKNMGFKLNDFVHGNSESIMINKQKPLDAINTIKELLTDLEHLFLISLFFVDSTLFVSEDYADYIENGIQPPEGSQYWVNGYILETFSNIRLSDENLFKFLLTHNRYSMIIGIDDEQLP